MAQRRKTATGARSAAKKGRQTKSTQKKTTARGPGRPRKTEDDWDTDTQQMNQGSGSRTGRAAQRTGSQRTSRQSVSRQDQDDDRYETQSRTSRSRGNQNNGNESDSRNFADRDEGRSSRERNDNRSNRDYDDDRGSQGRGRGDETRYAAHEDYSGSQQWRARGGSREQDEDYGRGTRARTMQNDRQNERQGRDYRDARDEEDMGRQGQGRYTSRDQGHSRDERYEPSHRPARGRQQEYGSGQYQAENQHYSQFGDDDGRDGRGSRWESEDEQSRQPSRGGRSQNEAQEDYGRSQGGRGRSQSSGRQSPRRR